MTDSKLLDSSIWVDYFVNGKFKEIVEYDGVILSSVLSLFEVEKKLAIYYNLPEEVVVESLNYLKNKSKIISIEVSVIENAVHISISNKLAMADSIVYTTALLNNAELITADNDFRGLKNAVVFDK